MWKRGFWASALGVWATVITFAPPPTISASGDLQADDSVYSDESLILNLAGNSTRLPTEPISLRSFLSQSSFRLSATLRREGEPASDVLLVARADLISKSGAIESSTTTQLEVVSVPRNPTTLQPVDSPTHRRAGIGFPGIRLVDPGPEVDDFVVVSAFVEGPAGELWTKAPDATHALRVSFGRRGAKEVALRRDLVLLLSTSAVPPTDERTAQGPDPHREKLDRLREAAATAGTDEGETPELVLKVPKVPVTVDMDLVLVEAAEPLPADVLVVTEPESPTATQPVEFLVGIQWQAAAPPGSEIAQLEFFINGTRVRGGRGPGLAFRAGPYPAGTLTYEAIARDEAGRSASTEGRLTIRSAGPTGSLAGRVRGDLDIVTSLTLDSAEHGTVARVRPRSDGSYGFDSVPVGTYYLNVHAGKGPRIEPAVPVRVTISDGRRKLQDFHVRP